MKTLYDFYGEFQPILNDIDGVYIPLDTTHKSIAISVSGGADSALLTFLLCSLIEKQKLDIKVHIISNIRMWKLRPWQRTNSIDVFEYIKKRFPLIEFTRHENFVPPEFEMGNGLMLLDEYGKHVSGDNVEIRAFAEYTLFHYNIDAYYNAVSKNPPDETITNKMESRSIDINEENVKLMIMHHMDKLACHPFRFIDKRWIIKQYIRLDILDLLSKTRSCEGDKLSYPEVFDDLDYLNYKTGQHVPECKQCFWCQEREWAIKNAI